VIDTLEAALWCFLTTDSYAECVLKAVNLGEDTDTTAAVAGGLAGLLYGVDAIPEAWLATLARREWIFGLCDKFSERFADGLE
jgi:ADP-ribosylglycohydrolase